MVGSVVLVYLENTICAYDEEVVRVYEELYKPKKPKDLSKSRLFPLSKNYSANERPKIEEVTNQTGLWASVKPHAGALKALNAMRSLGLDVRIVTCITPNTMAEKVHWIVSHLCIDWMHRIVFVSDKAILSGDILIDCDPCPASSTLLVGMPRNTNSVDNPLKWSHVVFDKPYNRTQDTLPRITDWDNWKIELCLDTNQPKLENNELRPYFNHGSPDSLDQDRFYLFDRMPDSNECHNFCRGTAEDRNIIVVDSSIGVITKSFKGKPDECNNALLSTYSLHKQEFPLPIRRPITRIVPLKVLGTLRKLIGKAADSSVFREMAKNALRANSTFQSKVETLQHIDFCQCLDLSVGDFKYLAFQMAQTLALCHGREDYTKQSAAQSFPELEPFLYRREQYIRENLHLLNKYRDIFIEEISSVRILQEDSYVMFCCDEERVDTWNQLRIQSRGMVIDNSNEVLIAQPLDHCVPQSPNPSWTCADDKPVRVSKPQHNSAYVSAVIFEGNIHTFGEDCFHNHYTEMLKQELLKDRSLLTDDNSTYIFLVSDQERPRLIAKRLAITNTLVSYD